MSYNTGYNAAPAYTATPAYNNAGTGGYSDTQGLLKKEDPHTDPRHRGDPLPDHLGDTTKKERSCTDIICCILFVLGWIAMITIGVIALQKGNPRALAQPYDSDNHACGVAAGFEDYQYIYFARPSGPLFSRANTTVCVRHCPKGNENIIDCIPNSQVLVCRETLNNTVPGLEIYSSKMVLDKICMPTDVTLLSNVQGGLSFSNTDAYIGDLTRAYDIVWACIGIALVLGFIYMLLLRWCAGPLVWLAILFVIGSLATLGAFLLNDGSQLQDSVPSIPDSETRQATQTQANWEKAMGIVFIVFAGLILVLVLVIRKYISLAIIILKAAGKFVTETFYIIVFPPIMFAFFCGTFAFFFYIGLNLYSGGDFTHSREGTNSTPFGQVKFDPNLQRMFIWNCFFGLWNLTFNIGFTDFVIASAACLWYFNEDKNKLTEAFYRAVRYHSGSIAFGSIVLSWIWTINWIFWLISSLVEKCSQSQNGCLSFSAKCCMCCFDCYFRFLRFFIRGAYTLMGITGRNFLESGRDAVYLGVRNTGSIVFVLPIVEVFSVIGKAFITLVTMMIGYSIITKAPQYTGTITHPLAPTMVFGIIGYFVSSLFLSVYGVGTEAILYCILVEMDIRKTPTKKPDLFMDFKDLGNL
jgi:choline transporter-like protein 2/4/5